MATDVQMPDELKKLTALLTPKPAPPAPPPKKGLWNDFMRFIKTGNLLAVTISFVIFLVASAAAKAGIK